MENFSPFLKLKKGKVNKCDNWGAAETVIFVLNIKEVY
jgi:hypothetical protein